MQPCAVVDVAASNNPEMIEHIQTEISQYVEGLNSALEPRERLDRVIITGFNWSAENSYMTSTMKVSRRHIRKIHESSSLCSKLTVEVSH